MAMPSELAWSRLALGDLASVTRQMRTNLAEVPVGAQGITRTSSTRLHRSMRTAERRVFSATNTIGSAAALGVVSASLGLPCRSHRRSFKRGRGKVACLAQEAGAPIFANILSKQPNWRAAVAEICEECDYLARSRSGRWHFGMAMVSGFDAPPLVDIAKAFDERLGTHGVLMAAAVDGCAGNLTDGRRGCLANGESGIALVAVHLPDAAMTEPEHTKANAFFISKKELMQISALTLKFQGQTRVRGAEEAPGLRAWRHYLGVESAQPKGMLLFVDPLATKYVVQEVLAGLDMAYPNSLKFGGVCADLSPRSARVAIASSPSGAPTEAGVAGILIPSNVSLHTMVTPSAVRIGPELRVTKADKQVVTEINGITAADALAEILEQADPVEKRLIERSGLLIGLEAPKQLDPQRNKVYDDMWGSSQRAPSYAHLAKTAGLSDWLVRSIEKLPDGAIVVRRDDLKQVPRKVGASWLRMQLHVHNGYRAREELRLMLQRYFAARFMLPQTSVPFGAMSVTCSSWASSDEGSGSEVAYRELREAMEQSGTAVPDLPIAAATVCGEIAPPGVTLGGLDSKRTARHGHTASCAVMTYEPW
mmetsp:Transcript_57521/g.106235  ORF Transcript_57521/g.106235 Transcript_57521/m.106235 type:complete len:593 (-) Transcript_57521:275-2053(-)